MQATLGMEALLSTPRLIPISQALLWAFLPWIASATCISLTNTMESSGGSTHPLRPLPQWRAGVAEVTAVWPPARHYTTQMAWQSTILETSTLGRATARATFAASTRRRASLRRLLALLGLVDIAGTAGRQPAPESGR